MKIKRQVEEAIARELSLDREHVAVIVREAAPKAAPAASQHTFTGGIGKVLAVASGKGGVGKSTAGYLAPTPRNMGYRVGILDADIYGPSQPKMFGVEGYLPDAERIDGEDCILPADAMGIKLMSIGFFIKPLRRTDLARRHGDQRPAPDDPPDQAGAGWTSCSSIFLPARAACIWPSFRS